VCMHDVVFSCFDRTLQHVTDRQTDTKMDRQGMHGHSICRASITLFGKNQPNAIYSGGHISRSECSTSVSGLDSALDCA